MNHSKETVLKTVAELFDLVKEKQSKVDELQKQMIDQGQRFNMQNQQITSLKKQLERLGYTDNGGELMKPPIGDAPKFDLLDELQRRNQMLNDNIKEQGQKLVYQNEVIETQAEKLLCLRDEKAELQKRVDAVKQLIQEYRDPPTEDKTFCHALSIVADELEQALKGGLDE